MAEKPYFTHGVHASHRDLITSTTQYSGQLKRYFSSLDAEIFIGGERLLDISRLDFSYEEKKMPFYGFNSFMPSRVFTGQKIIQGTFIINFTEPGYIAKLLQKIPASALQRDTELVGQSCSIENSPLFAKAFDILVGYGGYNVNNEQSFRNNYQILEGVYINGYQQMLDTSGEPIYEMYSFIAKNLKFGGYKYESSNDNNGSGNNSNTDSTTPTLLGGVEFAEDRLASEVADLRAKCSKDEKLLGVVYDIKHSLHVKDKKSHLYVEFPKMFNGSNAYVKGNVKLTIHDNEIQISQSFTLVKTAGNQFGVIIDEELTNKLKRKLQGNTQKLASCSVSAEIMHGNKRIPMNEKGYMHRGSNY